MRVPDKLEDSRAKFPFAWNAKDAAVIMAFFLDVLLFSAKNSATGVQAVKIGEEQPAGLSHAAITQLTNNGKKAWGFEELGNTKFGILTLLYSDLFPSNKKFPHFIVASCASSHDLVDKGEGGLKRFKFDLEDAQLVQELYMLYQGTPAEKDPNLKRREGSPAVKGRILIFLQKSLRAANHFPGFIQVIFDCLYGQSTTKKLKQAGMGFAHWVCRMAEQATLTPVAPVLLSGLLKMIKEEVPSPDMVDEGIRGFNFVAISTLCKRVPKLLQSDFSILELFFQSLATESATMKIYVQEGLSMMMGVLQDLGEENATRLEDLLIQYMAKEEYQCRLISIKYAIGIFPFHHSGARYICLLGAADHHMEVRDQAKEGLLFPSQRARVATTFSSMSSNTALPTFEGMVSCIHKQNSRRQLDTSLVLESQKGEPVLTFMQDTFHQILLFLRLTLLVNSSPDLLLDPLGDVLDPVIPSVVSTYLSKQWKQDDPQNSVAQYYILLETALNHLYGLLLPFLIDFLFIYLFIYIRFIFICSSQPPPGSHRRAARARGFRPPRSDAQGGHQVAGSSTAAAVLEGAHKRRRNPS